MKISFTGIKIQRKNCDGEGNSDPINKSTAAPKPDFPDIRGEKQTRQSKTNATDKNMQERQFTSAEAQQNMGEIITGCKETDNIYTQHHMNILLRVEKRIHRAKQQ